MNRVVATFKETGKFLGDLAAARSIIFELAKHDFRSRYMSSYLGVFWAFVQPVITLAMMWFVFTYGFRATTISSTRGDVPFALWLMPALVGWNFFADGLSYSSNAIISNAFLVKKTALRLSILPIMRILSASIVHAGFVVMMAIFFIVYENYPDAYWIQLPYYMMASFFLLLGLGWAVSALTVFVRDIESIISISLQLGFWLTPVFWDAGGIVNPTLRSFVKLNPIFYLTQGYRDCFVNKVWFWERPFYSLYYITVVGLAIFMGALIFKRLRPHFADVL